VLFFIEIIFNSLIRTTGVTVWKALTNTLPRLLWFTIETVFGNLLKLAKMLGNLLKTVGKYIGKTILFIRRIFINAGTLLVKLGTALGLVKAYKALGKLLVMVGRGIGRLGEFVWEKVSDVARIFWKTFVSIGNSIAEFIVKSATMVCVLLLITAL
jgi:hypothetical protein